jgi:hypothetical protein
LLRPIHSNVKPWAKPAAKKVRVNATWRRPSTVIRQFRVAGRLCLYWEAAPHTVNEATDCDVAYWQILLQKSAATDGSVGHFAKDDRL